MASTKVDNTTSSEEYTDFGTRYEALLLQQRKVYGSFLSLTNDDDRTNIKQPSSANAKVGTAAIITSHAAMSGMIQSKIFSLKQQKRCKKTDDEVEDLTALWEYTLRQQNYDHDSHITQRDEKGRDISFGTLCSMAALEDYNHQEHTSFPSGADLESVSCSSEEDVDGFFEDYPECVRKDSLCEHLEDFNNEHVNDKSGGTDDVQVVGRRPSSGLHASVGLEMEDNSINRKSQSQSISSTFDQVKNPYAARANKVAHSDPPPHSKARVSSSRTESSWDSYTPKHAQGDSGIPINTNSYSNNSPGILPTDYQTLQDNSKKNPFCTAREFKYQQNDGSNANEDTVDFAEAERPFDNNSQGYKNVGGPYPAAPTPSDLSHNPNRPNLSAGLKRKFQLPKPRNGTTNCNAPSKGEGGQVPRQSSKEAEEDDPLPEELKGLDRELISKIENEIVDSGDPISFRDIAGLEDAKQAVLELVCWPMKRPDLFTGLRRGPNGLLLFGPPGTGKTLIGKAIAHESGATFFSISSSSLTSKWIGEGEKLVRTLFAVAAYREPAVVFIDEIDSLLTQRKADENEASRRIKTEFLVQLDGTGTSRQGQVLAIGATNRPHELDDAARRRFVKRLYIPLPERPDREILLRTLLAKNSHNLTDKDFTKLSSDAKGFSGADLKALCTDAALGPIRQLGVRALEVNAQDVPPISYRHFRHALKGMRPSVAQSDLDIYIEWNNTYGSKSASAEDYAISEESDDSSGE